MPVVSKKIASLNQISRSHIFTVAATLLTLLAPLCWAGDKPFASEGVHRMVEVVHLSERSVLTDGPGKWVYESLIDQGVGDADIRDGSIAHGRVYCCKKNPADDFSILFYTPPEMPLKVGDRVEIRLGRPSNPKKNDPGVISTAIRIREDSATSNGSCRWIPEEENLWLRVLTCDWMESEGWVYQKGTYKTWYKPAEGVDDTNSSD